MAGGTFAFGQSVTPSIQSKILDAPSLNTTPSPSEPTRVPSSELANLYATLSALAQRAVRIEQSPDKQERLFGMIADLDSWVTDEIQAASEAGAPVPNLPEPPPPPPPPAGGIGMGGPGMPPPAAPMAPNPGVPPAPSPTGMPG